jgi:hypothetical protein
MSDKLRAANKKRKGVIKELMRKFPAYVEDFHGTPISKSVWEILRQRAIDETDTGHLLRLPLTQKQTGYGRSKNVSLQGSDEFYIIPIDGTPFYQLTRLRFALGMLGESKTATLVISEAEAITLKELTEGETARIPYYERL